jgi:hypothetical protein
LDEKKIKKACFECRRLIPDRGYHCDICKVCVKQYDHHCTWINNCVGKHNILRFIIFLVLLEIVIAWNEVVSVFATISLLSNENYKYAEWFHIRYDPDNNVGKYIILALLAINFLGSLFFYPVFLLLFNQIKNVINNKTTYEALKAPSEAESTNKSQLRRNRNKVGLGNCKVMC